MAWEKTETGITFCCDTPDCKSVLLYDIDKPSPAPGVDFIQCFTDAKTHGWVSFKRIGRPWDYFCKGCALDAATAHRRYNEQENERERIKARNSY
jgi:hypothetical protein